MKKTIEEKIKDYIENRNDYRYGKVVGHKTLFWRNKKGESRMIPNGKEILKFSKLGLKIPQLAEWFQSKRRDAKVNVSEWSATKTTSGAGMRYSTGGGTRDYNGYKIEVEVDGDRFSHNSTDTYRKNTDLLDKMLKYV